MFLQEYMSTKFLSTDTVRHAYLIISNCVKYKWTLLFLFGQRISRVLCNPQCKLVAWNSARISWNKSSHNELSKRLKGVTVKTVDALGKYRVFSSSSRRPQRRMFFSPNSVVRMQKDRYTSRNNKTVKLWYKLPLNLIIMILSLPRRY